MLSRPAVHNAFNEDFISELTDFFSRIEEHGLRALILTGAGKSFCAGADLNWMKKMKDYTDKENYQDSFELSRMFQTINQCPVPVIGKINGASLGGGSGLVSVCDIAIAQERAQFGFTEVKLGLIPAVISPYVIAKIGESQARAFFLTGERFRAPKAFEIGLVHEVVKMEELDQKVEEKVQEILSAGAHASREAKNLIHQVMRPKQADKERIIDITCKAISKIRVADEAQRKQQWTEAIQALDAAAKKASETSQDAIAYKLGFRAAAIEQQQERFLEAADRYEQLALQYTGLPDAHTASLMGCWNLARMVGTDEQRFQRYEKMLDQLIRMYLKARG